MHTHRLCVKLEFYFKFGDKLWVMVRIKTKLCNKGLKNTVSLKSYLLLF